MLTDTTLTTNLAPLRLVFATKQAIVHGVREWPHKLIDLVALICFQ